MVLSFATSSTVRTCSVDAAISARSTCLTRPFQVGPGRNAFQNRTVVLCMWDPLDRFKIEPLAARVKTGGTLPRSLQRWAGIGGGRRGWSLHQWAGIELHVVRKLPRHLAVWQLGAYGDADLPLSAVPGGRWSEAFTHTKNTNRLFYMCMQCEWGKNLQRIFTIFVVGILDEYGGWSVWHACRWNASCFGSMFWPRRWWMRS
jgi:hypothetical protein